MSSSKNGFIYILKNHTIPNLLKINITYNNPEELLREINSVNELPTDYFILICKNIKNAENEIKSLYKLIDNNRVNKKKDFFRINQEKIKLLFDLIDGKEYKTTKILNREMKLCFYEGQQIRHKINDDIIIATYSYTNNNIVYKDKIFTSPSGFFKYHYEMNRKDRTSSSNGWKECEIFKNYKWISIFNL